MIICQIFSDFSWKTFPVQCVDVQISIPQANLMARMASSPIVNLLCSYLKTSLTDSMKRNGSIEQFIHESDVTIVHLECNSTLYRGLGYKYITHVITESRCAITRCSRIHCSEFIGWMH